jgi:pyruvate ferredoxin oxidoreductase delta subunit
VVKEYIRGAGIHASGTIAAFNKTGTWRILDPIVNQELWVDKEAPAGTPRIAIDMEYCKGCGICAQECPKQAITMVKVEA